MNFYRQYLLEREGAQAIESEHGFISYKAIDKDTWCICDYFVNPASRKEGHGKYLADAVFDEAKKHGALVVTCQSDSNAIGHDVAQKVILNYGFKPYDSESSLIFYFKEV